jgi:hypothetical protein
VLRVLKDQEVLKVPQELQDLREPLEFKALVDLKETWELQDQRDM